MSSERDVPVWHSTWAWCIHRGYLCLVNGPDPGTHARGWQWMIRRLEDPGYIGQQGHAEIEHDARVAAIRAAEEAADARGSAAP